jgi:hypothetical protein
MTRNAHFAFTLLAGFLACSVAQAQTRGGSFTTVPAHTAAAPAVTSARASNFSTPPIRSGARASGQATVIQVSPGGRILSSAGGFANLENFCDRNAVPGLGFDYVHLAAVSGNFRGNPPAFAHNARHHRSFITPVLFGGYPYYSDFADNQDYQQEQPQPQVIVIQQPVPATPVQQLPASAQEMSTEAVQAAPSAAPVREVGEFILVRRDGRILFASVFSVSGTQVQYVTPEGIRHTLPLSELDTGATQEMNEARGTTLQFHN